MRHLKNVGDNGEVFAAKMLEEAGYEIIERNYRTRRGEIDIIALRNGVLHFIEVKTRTSFEYGYPSDAVTEDKRRRIRLAAESYLQTRRMYWRNISIDVFEIVAELIEDCI